MELWLPSENLKVRDSRNGKMESIRGCVLEEGITT